MAEPSSDADARRSGQSLRGKLLIASPALVDPNFARTVVLITEHGDDGAMGVVLNRPSETEVGDVAPELGDDRRRRAGVHRRPGAAAGAGRARRVQRPAAAAWIVVADVGFVAAETDYSTTSSDAIRRGRVYAGYSGWGAGQLEGELAEEAWIVEPPLPAELFPDDPRALWQRRARAQGRPVRADRPDARRPEPELMNASARVCVIGAGSSGIASCQVLHARGIEFDCFEVGSQVGGNWRYMNDNGMSSAYRSLHINTSRRTMAYATYPMPEDYPDYPNHCQIAAVLRRLRRPLRLSRPDPLPHRGDQGRAGGGRRLDG